jgi:hypothetical protein
MKLRKNYLAKRSGSRPKVSALGTFALMGLSLPAGAQINRTAPSASRKAVTSVPATTGKSSPQPAAITLKNGTLTVRANNSDLVQILRDVSRQSGMVLEGPVRDVRVYGDYGPREPSAVLTELLAGLGYNILMTGSSSGGAPGKLMLNDRTSGPSPPAPPQIAREGIPEKKPEPPPEKIDEPQLGPGAIAHPPPTPPEDPQTRVQQNLQKLQQMRDAQTPESAPH